MTIPTKSIRERFQENFEVSTLREPLLTVIEHLKEGNIRPYWNPYGFLVWKLDTFNDGTALRLHIWPHDGRIVQHPVFPEHSHPWRLESLVLSGSIESKNYKINNNSDNQSHTIYEVEYKGNASYLGRTNKTAELELVSVDNVSSGEYYSIGAEIAHAANIDEYEFASTLVLTEDSPDTQAQVFVPNGGADEYHFKRYRPEPHRVDKLLAHLEKTL